MRIQRDFQKFEVEIVELDKWFWPAFSGCWCGMQMGEECEATRDAAIDCCSPI